MDYREFIQLDLPVAVAIVSCGADWRVEEANAEFTDVLGYTEKELRETRPQKMVYDEDYANLVSVLENVVRTHDNGKMQLRIVRPDGKTRWVEMRCSVLAHYDVKPYVVLFLWDIDEEKRREEHQKVVDYLKECGFDRVVLVGPEFAAATHSYQTFQHVDEVLADIRIHKPQGYYILIKGSNSMKLSQLPEYL